MSIIIRPPVKIYALKTFLYIFLLLFALNFAWAQDKQALYNHAVDQCNFAAMKYVLAADTKKAEAVALSKKLPDFAFDASRLKEEIIKIYGPNSRTEELSNKILRYKEAYNERKPVDKQVDAVVEFIKEDRKTKREYLARLEKELILIRNQTVQKTGPTPVMRSVAANAGELVQNQVADGADASQTADVPLWLTLLVIFSIVASLANLWLFRKLYGNRHSQFVSRPGVEKLIRQARDFEIFPVVEKKNAALEKQIEQLRQELAALSAGKTVSISKEAKPVTEPPKTQPEQKTIVPETGIASGKVVELQVSKPVVAPEAPKTVKKYADYPKENGFLLSQLTDSSDRRSIYEITIPPDGEYAQFTIVDNKEIHEYAIQNRERLLKDACEFEISSSQHTQIEVLSPGKLHKNGNVLQIHSKAKIKFV